MMRCARQFAVVLSCSLSLACAADPAAPGTGGAGNPSGGSTSTGSGGATGNSGGATSGGSAGNGTGGTGASSGATGTGGSAGGSGGTAGAASMPVTPTEAGGKYTFAYGDVVFEVDAMKAGRVVSFKKGTVELMDAGDGANNYGSTFWPAPQSAWNWPPPAEIDSSPFTAALEGSTLVLTGTANAALGLSAGKRFSVDSGLDRVEIVYSLKNESAGTVSVAAWEITRVDTGGLTFYPAPSAGMTTTDFGYDYDDTTGMSWYDYTAEGNGESKLFQDGGTWLGHVQANTLFLKTFPDVPSASAAPGEAQIELYTNGSTYLELENQGAYTALAAGESLTYTVYWYLRAIPETVTVAARSATLVEFATGVPQ